MPKTPKIIYTLTDEAPALATHSLLPIIDAFTDPAGIKVETRDISLAGRIIALFPDYLSEEQRIGDHLAELGELAKTPEANIIKLPNISASTPQLKAAIKELQQQGYKLPDYPEEPGSDDEKQVKARYDKVKGSAVNPVLREGNSDRRAPQSVKGYARKYPHRMGKWSSDSQSHVAHMSEGDFYGSEKSAVIDGAGELRIELVGKDGGLTVLKDKLAVLEGEVVDGAAMSSRRLRRFIAAEIEDAKQRDVLFSLHLKATMMKVSDPIMFGIVVSEFYGEVLEKHADTLDKAGFDRNNGIGDLYSAIQSLPGDKQEEIKSDIEALYSERPPLAMVNSHKGITNLHVPSDVIIDASMPAMIRDSGKMWGADDALHDAKAVIPDRCYAGIYQIVIDDCKQRAQPILVGTTSIEKSEYLAEMLKKHGYKQIDLSDPAAFAAAQRVVARTVHLGRPAVVRQEEDDRVVRHAAFVEFVEQLIHSRPINLQIRMHQNVSKIRHADNLVSEITMEDLMFSKDFDGIRCGFGLRPPVLSGQVVSYIDEALDGQLKATLGHEVVAWI